MHRRTFLSSTASISAGTLAGVSVSVTARAAEPPAPTGPGRLRQSVCRWCYGGMDLDALCGAAASMGAASVELLSENEWSVPARHGLVCAVANGPTRIDRGLNRLEHHDAIVAEGERLLPLIAEAGIPNMIVFSGPRAGLSDSEGIRHCVTGVRRLAPLAERCGVTMVMELLNSRVDHPDYQCDHTAWGVEVVRGVGSPRFKLLYDIYHMQIMEGDVIRTIRENAGHIGHYHTGGVPGRREIDGSQELHYPAICRAIVETGYTGFLGQEFIPSRDPMTSLGEALRICRVE